eukprot:410620_1
MSLWTKQSDFPTATLQPTPCALPNNTIIYATRYDHDQQDTSGIFEYNLHNHDHKIVKLWKDTKYHPRWNTMIYSKVHDTILFTGGVDLRNTLATNFNYQSEPYKCVMIYHRKDDTVQYIDLQYPIGTNPKMVLTHNETYLHIIGGNLNNKHIVVDLISHEFKFCATIQVEHVQIQEQSVVHNPINNTIMMF